MSRPLILVVVQCRAISSDLLPHDDNTAHHLEVSFRLDSPYCLHQPQLKPLLGPKLNSTPRIAETVMTRYQHGSTLQSILTRESLPFLHRSLRSLGDSLAQTVHHLIVSDACQYFSRPGTDRLA